MATLSISFPFIPIPMAKKYFKITFYDTSNPSPNTNHNPNNPKI